MGGGGGGGGGGWFCGKIWTSIYHHAKEKPNIEFANNRVIKTLTQNLNICMGASSKFPKS